MAWMVAAYAVSPLVVDDADTTEPGCALRRELTTEWTILAESYALLPHTHAGGNANFYFSGGPQWKISERIVFSALIGTAIGHNSPDLTGTLELAIAF